MRASVAALAAGMLLFGTVNTLTVKFQDVVVVGRDGGGAPITFRHPVVQASSGGSLFF